MTIDKINEIFKENWKNKLTKYEIARIISARALQYLWSLTTDTYFYPKSDAVISIARGIKRGVLPITIRRIYPNGQVELISVRK
nr:RNA polymerase subunit K [Sulfolobus acidocaldarius]